MINLGVEGCYHNSIRPTFKFIIGEYMWQILKISVYDKINDYGDNQLNFNVDTYGFTKDDKEKLDKEIEVLMHSRLEKFIEHFLFEWEPMQFDSNIIVFKRKVKQII